MLAVLIHRHSKIKEIKKIIKEWISSVRILGGKEINCKTSNSFEAWKDIIEFSKGLNKCTPDTTKRGLKIIDNNLHFTFFFTKEPEYYLQIPNSMEDTSLK